MNHYFFIVLFSFVSISVFADESSTEECKPLVEINSEWETLRIRSHENAFLSCTVSQDKFNELIRNTLSNPEIYQINFKSLFMGRLIEYPWLSKYLAQQSLKHADWDSEMGQYNGEYINTFVAGILSSPELLSQIQEPFAGTGYIVTVASVEKVLIGKANEIEWLNINEALMVPYDVMVHFKLEKSGHATDNLQ